MVTLSWDLIQSEKIGRWSDRSLIIRPLLQQAEMSLVKMLSIKVALWNVILVGLEISGKNT